VVVLLRAIACGDGDQVPDLREEYYGKTHIIASFFQIIYFLPGNMLRVCVCVCVRARAHILDVSVSVSVSVPVPVPVCVREKIHLKKVAEALIAALLLV